LTGGTKDVVRNQKAMKLFQKAAKSGNKIAGFMLGYAYYKGFVVPQDYEQAYKLVKSAATGEARLDEAQLVLAEMYTSGYGTVQNYQNAITSVKSAVSQGNKEAFMIMAKIYTDGKISLPNLVMAHALYILPRRRIFRGRKKSVIRLLRCWICKCWRRHRKLRRTLRLRLQS
jgi:hypothetical protein